MNEHMISKATTSETSVDLNPLSLPKKAGLYRQDQCYFIRSLQKINGEHATSVSTLVVQNYEKILGQSVSEHVRQKKLKTEK
jgi:hypothetical protein